MLACCEGIKVMTESKYPQLSRVALVALVVGSMVGARIFTLPAAFGWRKHLECHGKTGKMRDAIGVRTRRSQASQEGN
jgi:hypothetical protein